MLLMEADILIPRYQNRDCKIKGQQHDVKNTVWAH